MPPPNRERRDAIADAAMRVLAAEGARGLTHRAVDAEAGTPTGTTSRYFPSRDTLLRGVAERMRHIRLAAVEAMGPGPDDPARLPAAIAATFRAVLTARPEHAAALFELYLERGRRPELRGPLAEASTALAVATVRVSCAAGVDLSAADAELLVMTAEGIALAVLTTDPGDLDRLETLVEAGVARILAGSGSL